MIKQLIAGDKTYISEFFKNEKTKEGFQG